MEPPRITPFFRVLTFTLVTFLALNILSAATPDENTEKKRIQQLKFSDTPFEKISHSEFTPLAQRALQIQASQWKHSESEHFIVHYQLWDVRDRLMREAEFYYWKIKRDLKLKDEMVEHKSHIFIFETEAAWRQFQATTDILGISGVTYGHEFFCFYPKRKDKEFSAVVAHEMTHLVFNRFFKTPPPLWLNEGFAEYQGEKAYLSYYDKRYESPRTVRAEDLKAASFLEVTTWDQYPGSFYDKKTGLLYFLGSMAVEVLMEKGTGEQFVKFTVDLTNHPKHDFREAFEKNYLPTFKSHAEFEELLKLKIKRNQTRFQ